MIETKSAPTAFSVDKKKVIKDFKKEPCINKFA